VGEIAKVLREKEDSRALFHTKSTAPGAPTQTSRRAVIQDQAGHGPPEAPPVAPDAPSPLRTLGGRDRCAEVTIGDATYLLRNGESTFVPAGTAHRLANPGLLPLELIEVQIGEYTGEDDIIRFEDDFERA